MIHVVTDDFPSTCSCLPGSDRIFLDDCKHRNLRVAYEPRRSIWGISLPVCYYSFDKTVYRVT